MFSGETDDQDGEKLDTTNEITLLYMHELTKKGKRKTKEEKKKEEAD